MLFRGLLVRFLLLSTYSAVRSFPRGLSRLSPRSLLATLTFLVVAMVTVYVVRHVIGGGA